jgi:hypothetical protein
MAAEEESAQEIATALGNGQGPEVPGLADIVLIPLLSSLTGP